MGRGWGDHGRVATYTDAVTALGELVARKTQRPHLTLGELHELARQQLGRYRALYTTSANLTTQPVPVFSREANFTMRMPNALRIRMSISHYLRPVLLDGQNNVLPGPPVQVLVDGGRLANYLSELSE